VHRNAVPPPVKSPPASACDRTPSEAPAVPTDRPTPELRTVPLSALTFDARLQMRDTNGLTLYDPPTAARYAELLLGDDPPEFPPLAAVDDGSRLWLISGFNRAEAYRRAGRAEVEAKVYPGTFEDARLWCLGENAGHGKTRTDADCRRAFNTLVDDEALLARVLAGTDGGVHRALGRACGLSKGAVGKYLLAAGRRATRDGRLVDCEPSRPRPRRTPRPAPLPVVTRGLAARRDGDGAPDVPAVVLMAAKAAPRDVAELCLDVVRASPDPADVARRLIPFLEPLTRPAKRLALA